MTTTEPATPTQPIPAASCPTLSEITVLAQVLQDPMLDPAERAAIRAHIREVLEGGCGVAPQRTPRQAGM